MLGEDSEQAILEGAPAPVQPSVAMVTTGEPHGQPGAMVALPRDLIATSEALPPGVKPPMGRICRMCRQVRAPVIGAAANPPPALTQPPCTHSAL